MESKLRSFREVKGYRIRARDGKMGQIEDMLVDDEDWQIIYLIIDTSKWLPWSKDVILSIDWMKTISYAEREVAIDLETEQIKNAPEFDPSHPIEMDYEKALRNYYSEIIETQE
jgi:hypothetical protein